MQARRVHDGDRCVACNHRYDEHSRYLKSHQCLYGRLGYGTKCECIAFVAEEPERMFAQWWCASCYQYIPVSADGQCMFCSDPSNNKEQSVSESRFNLFTVAVFNPNNGDVVLEPTVVAATNEGSARNKATALLCGVEYTPSDAGEDATPLTLDKALDVLEVRVRPF